MTVLNLPNPIIFGPQRPQIRIRLEDGKQYVYSNTNNNLYFAKSAMDRDGTLAIGALYKGHDYKYEANPCPWFIRSKRLTLPYCDEPCRMLLQSSEELSLGVHTKSKSGPKLVKVNLREAPELYECHLLSELLRCATTPAEKKFAEMYYTWAICGTDNSLPTPEELKLNSSIEWRYSSLKQQYKDFTDLWHAQQFHLYATCRNPQNVTSIIQESLTAPALIPQVWLNYTYDSSQPPTEETDELRNMPKRVDFLFIRQNKMHIIEIDDPSHYAIYDESKKRYEVSEEKYTNNLKTERVLREQGFEIHRLSNWEILNATESQLIGLISDALGIGIGLMYPPGSPRIEDDYFDDRREGNSSKSQASDLLP